MLFDAQGEPTSITGDTLDEEIKELPGSNFPPPTPKPEWFDDEVNKIAGFADVAGTIPKYRVVWGMDENIKQFAMGKWRMKYVSMIDTIETTKGVEIRRFGKKPQRISAKEAMARYYDEATQTWTRNVKKNELIVPIVEKREVEIGVPLWVVEQFIPPEGFGTKEGWENERYLINPTNKLDYIDALGEYPSKGAYLHWFDLVDYNEEGSPCYRELNDAAVEIIRANHVANIARRKRADTISREQHVRNRDEKWNQEWEKHRDDMAREMLDVKKHKVTIDYADKPVTGFDVTKAV